MMVPREGMNMLRPAQRWGATSAMMGDWGG